MSAYEIVKTARHRLEAQPQLWIKGHFALFGDEEVKHACEPNDPRAQCFCVAGLLLNTGAVTFHEPLLLEDESNSATRFRDEKLEAKIFNTLESLVPPGPFHEPAPYAFIADWNDAPERTVDEVIDLLKKAEEKLRGTD